MLQALELNILFTTEPQTTNRDKITVQSAPYLAIDDEVVQQLMALSRMVDESEAKSNL